MINLPGTVASTTVLFFVQKGRVTSDFRSDHDLEIRRFLGLSARRYLARDKQ
jgi:hypothetical protein